jgi:hypothetical protein
VRQADSIERTLLDNEAGRVHWHCLSPRADATVRIADRTVRGLGYAERLVMTVKPWRLPFNELRWGRFLSSDDYLIWIDWRGGLSRTWAFLNGTERQGAVVTDQSVSLDDEVRLAMEEDRMIRSGSLSNTALRSLRAAASLVPRWRRAHESKWIARGTLQKVSGSSTGWALHEVVRW